MKKQKWDKPFFIAPSNVNSAKLWHELKSSINQKSIRSAMLYDMVDGTRYGNRQFGNYSGAIHPLSNWDMIVTTDASDYYNIDYHDVISALDKTIGFIHSSVNFDFKFSAKFKEVAGMLYKATEYFTSSVIAKTIVQASQQ
jgi:hypothetical protein